MASFLALGFVLVPASSDANHRSFDTAQECMQSGTVFEMPTCSSTSGGRWTASHPVDPATRGRNLFATFAVIWLLLVVGSVAWVVSTARQHGDPVGTALAGALVGGPLFVLLYGSNADVVRRARKVYRWTDRIPDEPGAAPRPSRDTASRLEELARLRDEGLITDQEHDARRREILDDV